MTMSCSAPSPEVDTASGDVGSGGGESDGKRESQGKRQRTPHFPKALLSIRSTFRNEFCHRAALCLKFQTTYPDPEGTTLKKICCRIGNPVSFHFSDQNGRFGQSSVFLCQFVTVSL